MRGVGVGRGAAAGRAAGVGWAERAMLASLVVLVGASAGLLAGQILWPEPARLPGVTFDRLTATMSLLVAGIGAATFRFAMRYLDGEPGHRRFLRWLWLTVAAAFLLMSASHLLLLVAAWTLTSLGLHELLTFYGGRRDAVRTARKKFLISRLGDVALLLAIALIWREWQTLDLREFLARAAAPATWPGAPGAVALLVALAALTKSAQFPFHSWLPETMEAPAPVSALMHAGIINAGGVLLLRFAPLLAAAPAALLLLTLVGTLTLALGALAMWAQPDVKRGLAWSTVSQMGFMMVQCGLGAFPAAALHIVGHGCYKAWSFMRAGGLPAPARTPPPARPAARLAHALLGALLAAPAIAAGAALAGLDLLHSPGELALASVLALSLGQLWAAILTGVAPGGLAARAAAGLAALLAAATAACALYRGAAEFFGPALAAPAAGTPAWAAAVPPLACLALAALAALAPALGRTPAGVALRVHAAHGFYLGALANRLVDRIWPAAPSERTA